MKLSVVLAIFSFFVLATSAQADWLNTKWNMSVDQIKQLYPDATNGASFGSWEDTVPTTRLSDVHVSDGFEYDVMFVLPNDRLAAVVLNLRDHVRCSEFGSILKERYGQSEVSTKYTFATLLEWKTTTESITLFHLRKGTPVQPICRATYRRLPEGA